MRKHMARMQATLGNVQAARVERMIAALYVAPVTLDDGTVVEYRFSGIMVPVLRWQNPGGKRDSWRRDRIRRQTEQLGTALIEMGPPVVLHTIESCAKVVETATGNSALAEKLKAAWRGR